MASTFLRSLGFLSSDHAYALVLSTDLIKQAHEPEQGKIAASYLSSLTTCILSLYTLLSGLDTRIINEITITEVETERLFPTREKGRNWQAKPLQPHEAEAIKANEEASRRVLESYKLMLDFYGMHLVDEKTGELERNDNWQERYENLNRSSHNYLRITRILKSLGELGYEHLKEEFLLFILKEAFEEKELTRVRNSCQGYWIGTVKDDAARERLYQYIEDHKPVKLNFLWRLYYFFRNLFFRIFR